MTILFQKRQLFKYPLIFALSMVKAKAAVAAVKIKKKAWYAILAPQHFGNVSLGETYVTDPAVAVGRVIHANLKDITNNLSDQHVYLRFKIVNMVGNILHTEVISYYMTPSTIKKLTRRTASRMDESFVVVTNEGKRVRIKPVVVTVHKTVRSVCSELRRALQENVARDASKLNFQDLVLSVVNHKIQMDAKKNISKVYPVKVIEIKILEYAHEGKAVKVREEKKEEAGEKPAESEAQDNQEETAPKKVKKKMTVTEEMQEELEAVKEQKEAAESTEEQTTLVDTKENDQVEDTEEFGEEEKA